jgi:hypothetical protein
MDSILLAFAKPGLANNPAFIQISGRPQLPLRGILSIDLEREFGALQSQSPAVGPPWRPEHGILIASIGARWNFAVFPEACRLNQRHKRKGMRR